MTLFVSPRDRKRLKQYALDADTTLQRMMHEAMSNWLNENGHPPLDPMTANRPSGKK